MSLKTGKNLFAVFALFCSFVSCVTRAHGGRLDEPFKARHSIPAIPTYPVNLESPKSYLVIKSIKPNGLCTEDQIQDIEELCMDSKTDEQISECVSDGIKRLCNLAVNR